MTRLIKAKTSAPLVRSFGAAKPEPLKPAVRVDPEVERLRVALAAAEEAVATAQAALAEAQADRVKAYADGEAVGLRDGLSRAETREAERLARLSFGVDTALTEFSTALDALEPLAAALSKRVLERVLGDAAHYPDLVARVIAAQVKTLAADTLIDVEVSRADFPTSASRDALDRALARPGVTVAVLSDLGAGGCRLRLKLGTVEAHLDEQWRRIAAELDVLAKVGPT